MNASTMPPELKQKKDRRQQKYHHINLQLAALGQPTCELDDDKQYLNIADGLLKKYTQQRRLLAEYRCPADQRIEGFLNGYLQNNKINETIRLPRRNLCAWNKKAGT